MRRMERKIKLGIKEQRRSIVGRTNTSTMTRARNKYH